MKSKRKFFKIKPAMGGTMDRYAQKALAACERRDEKRTPSAWMFMASAWAEHRVFSSERSAAMARTNSWRHEDRLWAVIEGQSALKDKVCGNGLAMAGGPRRRALDALGLLAGLFVFGACARLTHFSQAGVADGWMIGMEASVFFVCCQAGLAIQSARDAQFVRWLRWSGFLRGEPSKMKDALGEVRLFEPRDKEAWARLIEMEGRAREALALRQEMAASAAARDGAGQKTGENAGALPEKNNSALSRPRRL